MKQLLLFLFGAVCLWAVPPTISNISLTDSSHNSVRICFTVSPATSYVQAKLGTVSGTYTAQASKSYQMVVGDTGRACLAFNGLADSTTYYVLPLARPNADNDTDICNVSGCGAVQQSLTTGAATAPVAPTAPTAYAAPNPDTSVYTIVRMIAGSPECKAAANVGPVTYGGGSWSVTANDTVQTVLNEVGYGAVLEFDQGITCAVPGTNTYNSGYWLGNKAVDPNASGIDDAAHRWVILRTKSVAASDFPPFGSRTSPSLGVKNAIFQANTQETSSLFTLGQVFSMVDNPGSGSTLISHHYLIQNITLQVNQSTASGVWGQMVAMGSAYTTSPSTYLALDRVILHGSPLVDTAQAISAWAGKVAITGIYMDNIHATSLFAQGIFTGSPASGPYTITNNYFECECMTFYQEMNEGYTLPANDITYCNNTVYAPLAQKDAGYLYRQPIEFKGGHRIKVCGNLIDGSWVYQNEGPAVFISGINDYAVGDGINDVLVQYNLIRNVATVFDCMGVRPADSGAGPDNAVHQRIWFGNNLAYNLGYANHMGMGGGGGGAVSSLISHRPGCSDVTVTQNTFGFSDAHDTRAGSTLDFIPTLYSLGGGTTLASGLTHTNNVQYVSVGSSANRGRIFADDPQILASHPRTPAVTTSGTPTAILASYAITTTNSGVTPSYTWTGNVNICGQINAGSNSWADMDSATCTTYQSGMPGTGTWATGNTMALRAANVGLNTTTWNCTGCGSAGVNTATLYSTMGVVTGVSVVASLTSAVFTYTAPDSRACVIDVSSNAWSTWARTTDAGGAVSRSTVVPSLVGSTAYAYRLLCYFSQTSPLFTGTQATDGSFTTNAGASLMR